MSQKIRWGSGSMRKPGVLIAIAALASLSSYTLANDTDKAREGFVRRGDLEIVDCALPGEVRQLGSMTYLSPRRPVRTTAADCRIRGGEYVAYDRANMKDALRVWLAAAESGDAKAQFTVGEIYERGTGAQPDYATAALWYQRAVKQGYTAAMVNLGFLYENGLGVAKDALAALNLYRQASGIPADSLIYAAAAQRQQEALRRQLTQTIQEKEHQIDALQSQVADLESKLQRNAARARNPQASTEELNTLRTLVQELRTEKADSERRLASMPQVRAPSAEPTLQPLDPRAAIRTIEGQNLGRYYALVIGDQDYRQLDKLSTPREDAARVAQVLKDRYGFSVQVIDDADDVAMLKALNDLDRVLRPEDNLLIYYAGHGYREKSGIGEVGYWLPVNADRPPDDTYWVPTAQISAHIGRLAARRILVVADSCYAGLLSDDPSISLFGSTGTVSADYLRYKLPRRARLLLSSGGDEPVLDAGGQGDSVFAEAFVHVLQDNQTVLSTPALFERVREAMRTMPSATRFHEVPDLQSIKSAGHEMGDFFFVPARG